MAESTFDELKRYVGFGPEDEGRLRELYPHVRGHLRRIADVFYQRILEHEEARKALEGGERQVGHLKGTLERWMDELFQGPWDAAYADKRSRIGRVHVRIQLPQHYMFGAMNLLRQELLAVLDHKPFAEPDARVAARSALEKMLDLELAMMLDTYREDLLAQSARAERLSTFGQLVGSISHELRNPLAVIETSLHVLKARPLAAEERAGKHIARIAGQVEIANRIVGDMLDLIREVPVNRQPVRLDEVTRAALSATPPPEGISVQAVGLEGAPPVLGDASQLRQLWVNLLQNSYHAAGDRGWVSVRASAHDGTVEVTFEDSGPGVDPAVRHRLFEPLITTKAKGVGLGLALVKHIAERHGGSIRYAPAPGSGGARFVLTLLASA